MSHQITTINQVEERVANQNEFDISKLKMHTKMLAQEFNNPIYEFVGDLNIYCHIHESYSQKGFKKLTQR